MESSLLIILVVNAGAIAGDLKEAIEGRIRVPPGVS
jgi:hypothetical protein